MPYQSVLDLMNADAQQQAQLYGVLQNAQLRNLQMQQAVDEQNQKRQLRDVFQRAIQEAQTPAQPAMMDAGGEQARMLLQQGGDFGADNRAAIEQGLGPQAAAKPAGMDYEKLIGNLMGSGTIEGLNEGLKLKQMFQKDAKSRLIPVGDGLGTMYNTETNTYVQNPYKTNTKATWTEPYNLGGATVQRNNETGEIRTAVTRPPQVHVSAGGGVTNDLNAKTIDFMARQALNGDKSVMAGLARSKGALAAVRNRMAEIAPEMGVSPEQLANANAEFTGRTAEQRTLGTQAGNIRLASDEAKTMIGVVKDISSKVDRTQFPTWNALANAVAKGTGDENIVELNASLNALVNIYARAINPRGVGTVSDKNHAREVINAAYSNGQINSITKIMEREMEAAKAAPENIRREIRSEHGGDRKPLTNSTSNSANTLPMANTLPEGAVVTDTVSGQKMKVVGGKYQVVR